MKVRAFVLASFCAAASSASGQAADDPIARCAAIEDSAERLACYDGLDRRTPPPRAAPRERSAEPARASGATEPAPASDGRAARSTESTTEEREARDAPGADVVIVEIRSNSLGDTWFLTAAGERFRKTGNANGRFPEVPFTARLAPASRGSYFLSSPLGGPRVRLSRDDP